MSLIPVFSPAKQGQKSSLDQAYEYDYNRFVESLMEPDLKYPMVSHVFKKDTSLYLIGNSVGIRNRYAPSLTFVFLGDCYLLMSTSLTVAQPEIV